MRITESSPSDKAALCRSPTVGHSGQGKATETYKKISGYQELWGGSNGCMRCAGQWKYLPYGRQTAQMCGRYTSLLPKLTACVIVRVLCRKPQASAAPMCRCGFPGMVVVREALMGAEGLWEIPVLSTQFCCELKIAIKDFSFFNSVNSLKNACIDTGPWIGV